MRAHTLDAYVVLGVDREYDLTEDALLRAMDQAGVARAVVAAPDRQLAVAEREGNDAMLAAAGRRPDRFVPSCTANPWRGEAAVDEVRRALGAGARMVVLHPAVQGVQANDELVWPLVAAAARAGAPVYVHTGPPGHATPWMVVDLARRFPEAALILGHCGATDLWNDVVPAARAAENLYLESSLARPFLFAGYLRELGAGRGVMGSFAPLNDLGFEWARMREVLAPEAYAQVYGPTLAGLLGEGRP